MAAESPEAIARWRRHTGLDGSDRRPRCPANASSDVADCTCEPTPGDLAGVWQGAARMARARRTAGLPLSADDRRALDRYPEDRQ
jgi:hypothetical protein